MTATAPTPIAIQPSGRDTSRRPSGPPALREPVETGVPPSERRTGSSPAMPSSRPSPMRVRISPSRLRLCIVGASVRPARICRCSRRRRRAARAAGRRRTRPSAGLAALGAARPRSRLRATAELAGDAARRSVSFFMISPPITATWSRSIAAAWGRECGAFRRRQKSSRRCSRRAKRWSLPVAVLGSASTNSISRGYL